MVTEEICSNCQSSFTGNFCGNCGQKRYQRISKTYIWEEVQDTVLHTNRGFLFSCLEILKNPGRTAREFLEGKRIKHYRPLVLTFVLSGISAFFSFRVLGLAELMSNYYADTPNLNSKFMNDYLSFFSSYNSIIMLLLLPVIAFFTKLGLRKWGQNYYEHIIMNAYILSFYTLISILIFYPLMYFLQSDESLIINISMFQLYTSPLILIWFYKGFYPNKTWKSILWKVILLLLLFLIGFIGIIILGILVGVLLSMLYGDEMIKYFQPG
ncbi:DUF3667 domain-containing protein [Belliella kenyensis]|uniref:DUF3667 domain-containing protein n=1 Tax=Belliella kenyensis TaxID=1472724 RepID=A0ABV8EMU6_9BACT|nr:DUF3667 domain-containing protein [Belliella kenyensis]MCH7403424.1 DUF3667 domain-containing protein [Belliella kenyensis]MDN3601636.1 DUF3667 domain-containing protein [Belliella kenyensis]